MKPSEPQFFIKLLPQATSGSFCEGVIRIGNFQQSFLCMLDYYRVEHYLENWRDNLPHLFKGAGTVIPVSWPLRSDQFIHTWDFWPKGELVECVPGQLLVERVDRQSGIPYAVWRRRVLGEQLRTHTIPLRAVNKFLASECFAGLAAKPPTDRPGEKSWGGF